MNALLKPDQALSITAPAHIRALAPYVGGKPISEVAREFGLDEASIVKLASNENPLGMPESARLAMTEAFAELARYPDDNAFDLRRVLSERLGVAPEAIMLGSGSSDVLYSAALAFAGRDSSVLFSQYAFVVYPLATQKIGARAIVVPATADLGHDLDAMLAAIEPDTRLLYVANPTNPTGNFIEPDRLQAFIATVPGNVVVVLDEAYTEFLPREIRYDAVRWLARFPNLVISRTFSKAFGLAGLRVGYGVGAPALIDLMNRVRAAFNVNSMAQAAAIAALGDEAFLQRSYEVNLAGYAQLTAGFDRMGIEYNPSRGNFVLFRAGQDDGAGARVNLELLKRGVIVRPVGNYGLPQWLRVSIGLPHENAAFLAALEAVLGQR
ncbi:histidinol-phosphate transaminase [soil metagenome]